MRFCWNCGAALPPGAQFCSACGADAKAQPAATPPVEPTATPPVQSVDPAVSTRRSKAIWMAVPIAILAVVGIAFLLLAGLPFGGDDSPKPAPRVEPETIVEGESQRHTTAIVDPPDIQPSDAPPATTVTAQPPAPAPPPVARTTTVAPPRPAPAPARVSREPRELSESDTMSRLRNYITSRDDYGVTGDCLQIESHGYSNRGYNLKAVDTCDRRPLGRWRVDTRTAEIFRQREDGRYLRP